MKPYYLVQLALFDVYFRFGRRRRLCRLKRKAGQRELRSRDGVEDTNAPPPDKDVDERVLEQRREDEDQTDRHPDIHRLDVRDSRHRRVDTGRLSGRRQHGQQADDVTGQWSVEVVSTVSRPMTSPASGQLKWSARSADRLRLAPDSPRR